MANLTSGPAAWRLCNSASTFFSYRPQPNLIRLDGIAASNIVDSTSQNRASVELWRRRDRNFAASSDPARPRDPYSDRPQAPKIPPSPHRPSPLARSATLILQTSLPGRGKTVNSAQVRVGNLIPPRQPKQTEQSKRDSRPAQTVSRYIRSLSFVLSGRF